MRRHVVAIALLLAACSTTRPAPAVFDLGPPGVSAAPRSNVQVLDVTAPAWLAGSGLAYRLEYRDPYRREVYRDSRWAAPPADLLEERLRQRSASSTRGGPVVQVRLELEEFSQVFSSPAQSRVLLRVRAWRSDAAAPKVFEISQPAPSADAAGAVQALSGASDALIDQILRWAGGS
jgi:cholesterol transport system auxiliary component